MDERRSGRLLTKDGKVTQGVIGTGCEHCKVSDYAVSRRGASHRAGCPYRYLHSKTPQFLPYADHRRGCSRRDARHEFTEACTCGLDALNASTNRERA